MTATSQTKKPNQPGENNDNLISVSLAPGESDIGNDFVDEKLGSISGNVTSDDNNDDIGDTNLEGVTVELLDGNSDPILDENNAPITATTDAAGNYSFTDLPTGEYQVRETNLPDFSDVNEFDSDAATSQTKKPNYQEKITTT